MDDSTPPLDSRLTRHVLGVSILFPAIVFAGLTWFSPSQYHFVVADAVAQFWPALWAILASAIYAILHLILLVRTGRRTPTFAAMTAMPLVVFAVSIPAMVGIALHAGVLALTSLAFAFAIFAVPGSRFEIRKMLSAHLTVGVVGIISVITYLGAGLATSTNPLSLPRSMGSLLILVIFLGTVSVALCVMALHRRTAVVFAIYSPLALLFFETNNHKIPQATARSTSTELEPAFVEWLKMRRDLDTYRKGRRAYPVIIVSSEGGGIYAAAHAYSTLATISRNCPTFSQHIFALVGVSGGAIGNVLYAGSVNPQQKLHAPCGMLNGKVDPTPVTTDHLAPVLARLLLLEPIDRLLPGQWIERDRAQILTDSFLSVAPDPRFAQSALTDGFDPQGARPAILSVATDIATGRRLIMSPFKPFAEGQPADWWPGGVFEGEDQDTTSRQISLIDAAGLSARFPWITPTGRLQISKGEQRILADGGYFENSGADTVYDLFDALRIGDRWAAYFSTKNEVPGANPETENSNAKGSDCTETSIILITNYHEPTIWRPCQIPVFMIHFALASREIHADNGKAQTHATPPPKQSFLADPLTVLLSSRQSRGEIALGRMEIEWCGTGIGGAECYGHPGGSFGMLRNDVSPIAWRLPLGWFLPRNGFERIVQETAPPKYFNYRSTKNQQQSDTEILIYHLDPSLYDENASPSIGDLLGGP